LAPSFCLNSTDEIPHRKLDVETKSLLGSQWSRASELGRGNTAALQEGHYKSLFFNIILNLLLQFIFFA